MVNNVLTTSFRNAPWMGSIPIRIQFQRLFQVLDHRDLVVGNMSQ